MSKYSAVYYPHTTLRSPQLLRNSLLLWDYVDCIVPYNGFSITQGLKGVFAEAAEIIAKPRVPQNIEQDKVDKSISNLFSSGIPSWIKEFVLREDLSTLRANNLHQLRDEFLIYPQKFLHKTWNKLSQLELARYAQRYSDWAVPPSLGLLLMSELANALAGEQQHTITDRSEAYGCLFSTMTTTLGGEIFITPKKEQVTSSIDRLVTISVRVADPSKVKFERILDLRKREVAENIGDIKTLRHKYLDAVTSYSQQFTKSGLTLHDRKELSRLFAENMENDFRELKKELGMARNDILFSKEAGIAVLALAGSLAEPISLGTELSNAVSTIGIGALIRNGVKYTRSRRKALSNHAMSWLYLAGQRNFLSGIVER
jgi:hypothetical protein